MEDARATLGQNALEGKEAGTEDAVCTHEERGWRDRHEIGQGWAGGDPENCPFGSLCSPAHRDKSREWNVSKQKWSIC